MPFWWFFLSSGGKNIPVPVDDVDVSLDTEVEVVVDVCIDE